MNFLETFFTDKKLEMNVPKGAFCSDFSLCDDFISLIDKDSWI